MGKGHKQKAKVVLEKEKLKAREKKKSECVSEGASADPAACASLQEESCNCPYGCRKGEALVDVHDEESVVHTLCSNASKCNQLTIIHAECFNAWENEMIRLCKKVPETRHWGSHWLHDQLWVETRGYAYICTHCTCKCGGRLRKDLEYYQLQKAKQTKAPKKKCTNNPGQSANLNEPIKAKAKPKLAFANPIPAGPSTYTLGNYVHDENDMGDESKHALPVGMISLSKNKRKKKSVAKLNSQIPRRDSLRSSESCDSCVDKNEWEAHGHLDKGAMTAELWTVPRHTLKERNEAHVMPPPSHFFSDNRFSEMNTTKESNSSVEEYGALRESPMRSPSPLDFKKIQSQDYNTNGLEGHIAIGQIDVNQYRHARVQMHKMLRQLNLI